MLLHQAKLKSGSYHMVAWIDEKLNEKHEIRFKNDPRWWDIEKTYYPILDKSDDKSEWRIKE